MIQLVKVGALSARMVNTTLSTSLRITLRDWGYFRAIPEQIVHIPSKGDPLGRSSLLVCVSGRESDKTVVLLGHTDTVEVDDYGLLGFATTFG